MAVTPAQARLLAVRRRLGQYAGKAATPGRAAAPRRTLRAYAPPAAVHVHIHPVAVVRPVAARPVVRPAVVRAPVVAPTPGVLPRPTLPGVGVLR